MNKYSTFDVWLRGVLYVAIIVIGFLLNDETFRSVTPKIELVYLGAGSAGLAGIRAYIDLTMGRTSSNSPAQVEVVNDDSAPVPTAEKDKSAYHAQLAADASRQPEN